MPDQHAGPSPALIFDTILSFQRTAAIKAAVELKVFTAIGLGKTTTAELAQQCQASERGIRILCDYLTVIGLLTKSGHAYGLTQDTAVFLDESSPAYMGGTMGFLLSPTIRSAFDDLAATVRTGTTILPNGGSVAPEHPMWVDFARKMVPMMAMPAQMMAQLVECPSHGNLRILDLAAGHGIFGIAFAQRYPNARVTAQDWPHVLEVAREHAQAAGVGERYQLLPGSAFDVEFDKEYELILLTNFLHHFDPQTNTILLKKVHAALAKGGRAVALEFIPNEDRVSPPMPAAFSMTMLASTANGDAYTFAELQSMFADAGFSGSQMHELPPSTQRVVVAHK